MCLFEWDWGGVEAVRMEGGGFTIPGNDLLFFFPSVSVSFVMNDEVGSFLSCIVGHFSAVVNER